MSIPLPDNDSAKGASEDDGAYGVLGMVHWANLQRITSEELENIITDWRSIHGLPSEVIPSMYKAASLQPQWGQT
jgi:hypothetical protein